MHPAYVIDWHWTCMFISIFGTVTDEKETSVRAKCLRKKYMGVWRRGSSLMSRKISRFPSTVVRYTPRNRAKNTPCCSGGMGSPRRRNSDTLLWFSLLMLFLSLLGMNRNWKRQELRHTEHSDYHTVTYVPPRGCVTVQTNLTALRSHVGASSSLVRTVECDLSEHRHSHLETSFKHQSNSSTEIRNTSFFFLT